MTVNTTSAPDPAGRQTQAASAPGICTDCTPALLRRTLRTLPAALRKSRLPQVQDAALLIERALTSVQADLAPRVFRALPTDTRGNLRAWEVARAALPDGQASFEAGKVGVFLQTDGRAQALTFAELAVLGAFWRLAALRRLLDPAQAMGGLRLLSALDKLAWTPFLESVSRLDAGLRRDPAGVYPRMTARTRQAYRASVQRHANMTGRTELEVVQAALSLATQAGGENAAPPRLGHVGEYLLGGSAGRLRRELGGPALWTARTLWRVRLSGYLLGIALLTLLGLGALLWLAGRVGAGAGERLALGLLALIPLLVNAAGLVSWGVTRLIPPRPLPQLDYRDGLPESVRSAVVVPVLLRNEGEVRRVLARLERHFLASHDEQVNVVLLSDFADAASPELPGDEPLLQVILAGIAALNGRYGQHFFVFHRAREWNAQEGTFMGYERKRGKLEQFNAALLSGQTVGFSLPLTFPDELRGTRYILTLDADTQMLPGTLRHLVALLDHPLNRPEVDPQSGRLRSGYTLLQPRLVVQPRSARRSLFSRLSAPSGGPDLYSPVVSEAYHDLFRAAIFTGKGLYDVAAFSRTLRGRVPENALLSHDLFEGLHGRVAFVGDSVLLEDLPTHPRAYLTRLERWVRGDWALLPWLRAQVPLRRGTGSPAFGWLGRWKIAHNLLRSLFAPALLACLLLAWLWLPSPAWAWTLLGALALGLPLLTGLVQAARGGFSEWHGDLERWALALALLPQEALTTLGAAGLAIRRLYTGRHRLEWMTAAQGERVQDSRFPLTSLLSVALGALLLLHRPAHFVAALPLLAVWTAFPLLSGVLGRETPAREDSRGGPPAPSLPPDAERPLRTLARRTWLYFARFAGPDDHWLPPDHFQRHPRGVIAHRTSPTNIGLGLLSALTARDLGYLGWPELAVRVEETYATLDRLERHHGHWLNWYDTQTLKPLPPRYLSSVDSGNLLGAFVALRQGLLEGPQGQVWGEADWQGYLDTLAALQDTFAGHGVALPPDLRHWLEHAGARVRAELPTPPYWSALLDSLLGEGQHTLNLTLEDTLDALQGQVTPEFIEELGVWAERAAHHLHDLKGRRDLFLPWLSAELCPTTRYDHLPVVVTFAELPALLAGLLSRATAAPFRDALQRAQGAVNDLLTRFATLAGRTDTYIRETEWAFLDDPERGLLHVGLNLDTGVLDEGVYDLLASEARLSSYLAVALGRLDVRHWTGLGRPMTRLAGKRTLLSWSGTMFEYLMPGLLLKSPADTLLDDAARRAIATQQRFAALRGVPWGVSECGYSRLDELQNYQYRAFGVPKLALHRDAEPRLIVSPYASLLALNWDTAGVLDNLSHLEREGLRGLYGFYEAKDYGPSILEGLERRSGVVIESFMAHHQGMILVSLGNALIGPSMVERFHRDPRVQTAEMLLYETTPARGTLQKPWEPQEPVVARPAGAARPWQVPEARQAGAVHVLRGAQARVLLTASGAGASAHGEVQLSRWRSGGGEYGTWLYLQDAESGALWAATAEPIPVHPDSQTGTQTGGVQVTFEPHRATFRRVVNDLESGLSVTVTPEGVEVRHLTLTSTASPPRRLRVTLAAEVALNAQRADVQSPAFGNLGVESQFVNGVLLLRRRPGGNEAGGMTWAHRFTSDSPQVGAAGFETRREVFLGRDGSAADPAALRGELENFTGTPLDPMLALSAEVTLLPGQPLSLTFLSAAGPDEAQAIATLHTVDSARALSDALGRAEQAAAAELTQLDCGPDDFRLTLQLLSALLFPRPHLRPTPGQLAENRLGREALWAQGLSGDLPIVLLDVTQGGDDELVIQVLAAWRFWNGRGLASDLLLLNLGDSGYAQEIQEELQYALTAAETTPQPGQGQVKLLRVGSLHPADLNLLHAAANVNLSTAKGRLEDQLRRQPAEDRLPESDEPPVPDAAERQDEAASGPLDLQPPLGAFSPDGREYVITLSPGQTTPSPWVNILANAQGGTLVTESGASFTWAGNSGEFRLTPWSGDSVLDPSGETLTLSDPAGAQSWSLPCRVSQSFRTVRHGAGYTIYEADWHGLRLHVRVFVPPDTPLKIVTLTVTNASGQPRPLSAQYAVRWCLGASLETGQALLTSAVDAEFHAIVARQPWNPDWAEQVAFLAADREARADWPGQVSVTLTCPVNGSAQVSFLLGAALHQTGAEALLREYRDPGRIEQAFGDLTRHWDDLLGAVQVRTPDPLLDVFMNRWLLYQTLSSRLWGRTGFSQPGGAFGFRDQLQDVLSLLHAAPELARAHLLEAARHQFEAGDVLHWWHPPTGAGVRTRISDDLLWLPDALDEYARVTGDSGVFTETAPFLHAEELADGETERYTTFPRTQATYTLLDHALRAIERADRRGAHGLPLIGSGDWNDGLNRVGDAGRGESVWLAFFLGDLLRRYALRLQTLGMTERASDFHARADTLRDALETHGWDGQWYRRAYDDGGEPLGTRGAAEAQIDALPQAWAVLTGLTDPARARQGLTAADAHLWREDLGIYLLLEPPFGGLRDVGYIAAYPPGIRENGGQYTHAATWVALAHARLGDGNRAHRLIHQLLPAAHTARPSGIQRYQREPYAVAGDVYSHPQHAGRGGWSWYTGAAGWIYRAALEGLLGISRQGTTLHITPALPDDWPGFEVWYKLEGQTRHIQVRRGVGLEVLVDGEVKKVLAASVSRCS